MTELKVNGIIPVVGGDWVVVVIFVCLLTLNWTTCFGQG